MPSFSLSQLPNSFSSDSELNSSLSSPPQLTRTPQPGSPGLPSSSALWTCCSLCRTTLPPDHGWDALCAAPREMTRPRGPCAGHHGIPAAPREACFVDRVLGNTLEAGKGHRFQAGGMLGGLYLKLSGGGNSKGPDQHL